jgi:hypothetical protein
MQTPINFSFMKKYLLLFALILGMLFNGHAQDDQKEGGRLEALKIAYLTKKLDLTTEEAQRFWPIYNKYMDEIRGVRQEQRQKNTSELDTEEKIIGVRKKYNGEFVKALSPEKVNNFFRLEKDFRNSIQRELQERRMNRQLNKRPFRN